VKKGKQGDGRRKDVFGEPTELLGAYNKHAERSGVQGPHIEPVKRWEDTGSEGDKPQQFAGYTILRHKKKKSVVKGIGEKGLFHGS